MDSNQEIIKLSARRKLQANPIQNEISDSKVFPIELSDPMAQISNEILSQEYATKENANISKVNMFYLTDILTKNKDYSIKNTYTL